jgi:flavin reductase (DIM6/NTAB) family NADH-FMN oxidoreductase RutF
MMGGANPPSCVICPVNDRHAQPKDTLRNIEVTGEYVINVSTRALAERLNQASYPYDYGDDEFDRAGLTRVPSTVVRPPRVAESPAALECVVHQIVHHGDGPLGSNYVIGEVRHVHVDDAVLRDGLPDDRAIEFIGRLGEAFYTQVSSASLFEMQRPEEP